MDTPASEVKAVTVMLGGGTADKYSKEQLHLLADWEWKHNKRWEHLLAPYRAGDTRQILSCISQISPPWQCRQYACIHVRPHCFVYA